jgi:acyl-CoA thioesterase FadM
LNQRFVAASSCTYKKPFAYPDSIVVGLRVVKLGTSSVQYQVGFFPTADANGGGDVAQCPATAPALAADDVKRVGGAIGSVGDASEEDGEEAAAAAAAFGTFVHVYVDSNGRPTDIDPRIRTVLEQLT